ncbi:MAG: threonine synthase, partial [Anaerolineae bacterium]|nr:threonine synthase [Anaerolineae bacterium]
IEPGSIVVGILTGHVLKDPDATIGYHSNMLEDISGTYANRLLQVGDDIDAIIEILDREKMPV